MAIKKYPKQSQEKLSDHFRVSEFVCPCSDCSSTLVDSGLVERLEGIRQALGKPIRITSGYRCSNYQLELKLRGYETAPVGTSQHEMGRAADIMCDGKTGKEIAEAAEKAGFKAIGIGHSFCHVDTRDDKERRWSYVSR